MKILFSFYDRPGYTGGPAINARRLLPELSKMGVEVHALIKYFDDSDVANHLIAMGIYVHKYTGNIYSEKEVVEIMKVVEKVQPDIYVCNINTPGCFTSPWLIESGIPTINTHRSDDDLNWGRAVFFSDRNNHYHTSACVCVNKWLETEMKNRLRGNSIKTRVIPSGVYPSRFKANFDMKARGVVYTGRFQDKQKNVLELLECMIELIKLGIVDYATLIGSGVLLYDLKLRVVEEGLDNVIKIMPRMDGDDYKKEMSRHHYFLFNSNYEGTPGAVMDAMSCGLIPIVRRYNGVTELVEDSCGFVFNEIHVVPELIGGLIIDNKNEIELSNNAINKISQGFSIEISANRWLSLFDELLMTVQKKKQFKIPTKIVLPKLVPQLLEHHVKPSLLKRLVTLYYKKIWKY
ncbi:glycosyltransferase family 4 protein [Marinoscillum sp.]|uniref:glycosyltransferase family 4 protein n=1 Tax=Marinoscillum sp. TaxID=2024838 RepID=UPI003BA9DD39